MPVSELGGGGVEIRILGAEINSSGLLQMRVSTEEEDDLEDWRFAIVLDGLGCRVGKTAWFKAMQLFR